MTNFQGVYTIMPTAFDAAGALDLASMDRLTKMLIGTGVDGVVVLGVLGEAGKLDQAEQQAVLETTVAASAGRIPVFAGAGAEGTRIAVKKATQMTQWGASGLLVAPPRGAGPAAIAEYYREIGEQSTVPIILHDYPAATGVTMSADLVERLAKEVEAVKVIKLEEPPSGPKVSTLKRRVPDLSVVGGLGGMYFYQELLRGADGIMTGFSFPEVLVEIFAHFTAGRRAEAAQTFYQAAPLLMYEFQPGTGLAIRKEIYRLRGAIQDAHVRHPGSQIDAQLQEEIRDVLLFCGRWPQAAS
ncbi:dihydrodipicolinate synthase family protein [Deinococcus detaillensis]|uniref:Dihydrodipicolinate synthase family protein n=1 Tax=Deinococcus detaillensis TaxID=2592048 RepID=A0A553UNC7_9DEIO|nr:dihydrodipicolinate synthase family protein [Deinococcus detaillensis]TSA81724.1 dihydrodipicolinate synthase family protein [Deinococcus detaillensis]